MFKVNLKEINTEQFKVTEGMLNGEKIYLINPQHTFFDWDSTNLHFRSSVYTSEGYPISLSFKKFFNLEEKPLIDPFNKDISNCSIIDKLDGSTLIYSKYKGQEIIRTRGTLDATLMPNGDEIELFKTSIIQDRFKDIETLNESYIFEWYSLRNKIILDPGPDTKFHLINIIKHSDYTLTPQVELDNIASKYNWLRPKRYTFNNLNELVTNITTLENAEGVCLYYNQDQSIRKIKSAWYLKLHAFKSNLSLRSLTELFISLNLPKREIFEDYIIKNLDFECLSLSKSFLDLIYIKNTEIDTLVEKAKHFTNKFNKLEQKEFALAVINEIGNQGSALCFALRKGKEIDTIRQKMLKFILDV